MESSIQFLGVLLANSPSLIACLGGALMALLQWHRAPRASLLLLLASIGYVLVMLSFAALQFWVFPTLIADHDLPSSQRAMFFTIAGFTNNVLHAALFGLMVWAVYAGRSGQTE